MCTSQMNGTDGTTKINKSPTTNAGANWIDDKMQCNRMLIWSVREMLCVDGCVDNEHFSPGQNDSDFITSMSAPRPPPSPKTIILCQQNAAYANCCKSANTREIKTKTAENNNNNGNRSPHTIYNWPKFGRLHACGDRWFIQTLLNCCVSVSNIFLGDAPIYSALCVAHVRSLGKQLARAREWDQNDMYSTKSETISDRRRGIKKLYSYRRSCCRLIHIQWHRRNTTERNKNEKNRHERMGIHAESIVFIDSHFRPEGISNATNDHKYFICGCL